MDDFKVYLPINKSAFPTGSYEKIIETTPSGETRTRFKIKGIASTTTTDRDNEIVSQLCLKGMENQINIKKLPIFSNHSHNWEDMIAYTNMANANEKQLEMDILTAYVETHPKVLQLIGDLDAGLPIGLSIGGKVTKSHPHKNGSDLKVLDAVELYETSIVGIGANPDAFLSLPDQIAKSMIKTIGLQNEIRNILKEESDKGESNLSDKTIKKIINTVEKSSGQLGISSYGKLGETTPASHCPKCGKPSDLRMVDGENSHYHCSICDLPFSVKNPVKEMDGSKNPKANPVNEPFVPIDEQRQSVPGLKSVNQEKKGDLMEKEEKSETEAPETKPTEEVGKGVGREEEDEEKEYNKFLKFLKRAGSEGIVKMEGVTTVPGGENANPKNTIGGSGGTATPVHQKSAKVSEMTKAAFHEEAGAEAFSTAKVETEDYSFAGIRKKMLTRK